MKLDIPNIIGLIGVVLTLGAYMLLQMRRIDPKAIPFSFCNMLGSLLVTISLLYYWNLASLIIEGAWVIISFYGLIKAIQHYFHKKAFGS